MDPISDEPIVNGPAAAAVLAAGVGCFILGFLTVAADFSKTLAQLLNFYQPTGPLSGVTTTSLLLWLVSWFVLARFWREKTVAIARINAVSFAFLALGILLTFPPLTDFLQGK